MDNPILNLLVDRLRPLVLGREVIGATAARAGVTLDLDTGESFPLFFSLHPDLPLPVAGDRRSDRRSPFASLAARLLQHLRGAAVAAVDKEPGDRVLYFRFSGDVPLELVYIAIPRRCDLVLLDPVGDLLARARGPGAPGDSYAPPPPPPGELDLFVAGEDELEEALRSAGDSADSESALRRTLRGADARLRAEIASRLEDNPGAALNFVRDLKELRFKTALHRSTEGDDRTLLLLPDNYRLVGGERVGLFEDPNEAARTLLRLRLRAEAVAELRSEIGAALKREQRRRLRLRTSLERDLRQGEQGAKLGTLGDLILANLNSISRGDSTVEVEDIVAGDGSRIVIELDPSIDPAANAERYYRRARKARRAVAKLGERLRELEGEERELERSQRRLKECGDDLKALRAQHKEIVSRGWLTQRQRKRLRIETPPGRRFVSSDGLEIVVGRSGPDNEVVTFKVGRDNDFWLHAAGYSGSHVLVRNPRRLEKPPPATLAEAAALAAYFSRARQSSNVQVHWTERRFLRKRKGGAPGQVLLTSYRSTTANPEIPDTVRRK